MATKEQLIEFADGLKQISEDLNRIIQHLEDVNGEPYYAGFDKKGRADELSRFKSSLVENQKLLGVVKNQLIRDYGYVYK